MCKKLVVFLLLVFSLFSQESSNNRIKLKESNHNLSTYLNVNHRETDSTENLYFFDLGFNYWLNNKYSLDISFPVEYKIDDSIYNKYEYRFNSPSIQGSYKFNYKDYIQTFSTSYTYPYFKENTRESYRISSITTKIIDPVILKLNFAYDVDLSKLSQSDYDKGNFYIGLDYIEIINDKISLGLSIGEYIRLRKRIEGEIKFQDMEAIFGVSFSYSFDNKGFSLSKNKDGISAYMFYDKEWEKSK